MHEFLWIPMLPKHDQMQDWTLKHGEFMDYNQNKDMYVRISWKTTSKHYDLNMHATIATQYNI